MRGCAGMISTSRNLDRFSELDGYLESHNSCDGIVGDIIGVYRLIIRYARVNQHVYYREGMDVSETLNLLTSITWSSSILSSAHL